jgi:Flp pilus assembly protein TadG
MRVTRSRGERGQATVEFALITPVLLLLIVGLIQFGKGFNYWLSLNHIANETARWAAVDKVPPTTSDPTVAQLKSYALGQAQNEELRDYIEADSNPGDPVLENIVVCYVPTGGATAPQIGDSATVRVKAPYSLPVVSGFTDLKITLTGTSTVRLEQLPSGAAGWPTCS